MEKTIFVSYEGQKATVGDLTVNRLLPNRYVDAVGPIVFLDHIIPAEYAPKNPELSSGDFAHPHRGIATFSYLLSGELEHFDSAGHHGVVSAGGAQWMKAGTGVVHDEHVSASFQQTGGTLHSLQFWINLPAVNKAEAPDYRAVPAEAIPEVSLPDGAGVLRVLIGEWAGQVSPVPTYSGQAIYHLKLNASATVHLTTTAAWEYAAFIPEHKISVNGETHGGSELVAFDWAGDEITFTNNNEAVVDLFVFGGEPYTEPIYAKGPFVMNSDLDIAHAYRDFLNGDYGKIHYAAANPVG